jgi:O-antigen/teichoic acid export membrane protein
MKTGIEFNRRLILANVTSSVVSRLLNVSVLVWMYQYLLRRISPEEYSVYAVVVSVMMFTPLLTTILTSGLARYTVEAYARGEERRVTQIVSTMWPFLLSAAVIIFAAGCAFAGFIDRILTIAPGREADARLMMTLLSLSVALVLATAPFSLGFDIRQRFVLLNAIQIGQDLLRIVLLFVLLVGVSPRVVWVVVASVSANVAGLIVTQIVSRRLVPALRFHFSEIHPSLAREVLSFGSWNFIGQIAIIIHESANPIILNKLATPLDVTTLHLGSIGDQQLRYLSARATMPLQPAITALNAVGDEANLRRTYLRGCRYEMWAALFAAVPVLVFAKELVALYLGKGFEDAAVVLALLLASYPFLFSLSFLPKVAYAKAKLGTFTVLALGTNILTIVLTIGLVGGMGMGAIGAALATFTIRALSCFIFIPLAVCLTGVHVSQWIKETVLPGLWPALVGLAVCAGLRFVVHPRSWVEVGLCAAAGCGCYIASLIGFSLRPEDRLALEQMLRWLRAGAFSTRSAPGTGMPTVPGGREAAPVSAKFPRAPGHAGRIDD